MKTTYNLPCNIAQTLNIIGDRWTLLIAHEILIGNQTFSSIKHALEGISSNLLSDRLKYLEESGLLEPNLYSTHPPRYKYTLTKSGEDLENIFNAMILWGESNLEKCYKHLVHEKCGHGVETTYYCPHCEEHTNDLSVLKVND